MGKEKRKLRDEHEKRTTAKPCKREESRKKITQNTPQNIGLMQQIVIFFAFLFYTKTKTLASNKSKPTNSRDKIVKNNSQTAKKYSFLQKPLWLIAIIFVFACLLYANTINHQYAYDDLPFIVNNEFVQDGIAAIPKILSSSYWDGNTKLHNVHFFSYRPIPAITFALETSLFNGSPFARHLIQVLLYAFMCSLLFVLLRKLFPKLPLYLILGIVLLFAAHPLHTEIGANLKNRDELLGFLFATLGLICLFHRNIDNPTNGWVKYLLAFICFTLALFSKETAIILIVSGLGLMALKLFKEPKQLFLSALPLISSLGIYGIVRMILSSNHHSKNIPQTASSYDNPIIFADGLAETLATKIAVLGKMQQLLWFPYSQQYEYGFAEIIPTTFANPMVWASIFIHLALLGGMFLFRKNKLVLWGIFLYFVSIAVIGNVFFTFPVALAERFLLIPSLYVCLLLGAFFYAVLNGQFMSLSKDKVIPIALFSIVLGLFSIKTISRNPVWKNNTTLFKNDIKIGTESVRTNLHYAQVLIKEAKKEQNNKVKLEKAIQHLEKAKNLKSDRGVTEIYLSLINAHKMLGNKDIALEYLNECLKHNPNYPPLLLSSAEIYIEQKEYNKATLALKKILDQTSNNYQAYLYLGFIAQAIGNMPKAIQLLEKSYQLNPNSHDVCNYLIKAYTQTGNQEAAQKYTNILKRLNQNQ